MPLEAYRRKRDFAKTAEPAGSEPYPADRVVGGRFVVGRHRASRLHYDLRLEMDGVLASWAVPKGPSLDPDVKRIAIHVEDHPIEYFDFEGTIPRGEYGAGDAIVWDWGTYEPEAPTLDPGRSIADGELKFRIFGQKLRGRYTLVRTRSSGARTGGSAAPGQGRESDRDGEPWLLIHKRDADAVPGWEPEDLRASVMTGRTNEEVAAGVAPRFEASPPGAQPSLEALGAAALPFPGFIEPMLATLATRAFDDPAWLFEIKWDGYRVEAVVRDGRVSLHTRNGKDAGTYFPGLLSPPDWIDARDAIVDGEVVAIDPAGMPDFGLLQERLGVKFGSSGAHPVGSRRVTRPAGSEPPAPLVFQAFDLLYIDGLSLLAVPLEERKRVLRSVLRDGPRVRYATHVEGSGVAFMAAAADRGLEGVMAKERRSPYEPGRRVATWLKLKNRPEQEFVIGGYLPGEGNASDLGSVIVGYFEDKALRYAGRVGSGFDGATRRRLRGLLDAAVRADPAFDPAPPAGPDLRGVVWSEPAVVIRVAFSNWTRDGVIRQPSFKGFELDRDPRSVRRERAVVHRPAPAPDPGLAPTGPDEAATPEELEALERLPAKGTWQVGGFELSLTNLDKVLFPPRPGRPGSTAAGTTPAEEPLTKRDLIRYLSRIAPAVLPHLAERALNLQRFPDGAAGPAFWQKQNSTDRAGLASAMARDRRRGSGGQRPPGRGPRRNARLAGQPGGLRDPSVDLPNRRSRSSDLRPDRHRPRREDDLGRDPRPGPPVPDGARPSWPDGSPEDDRQARDPGLDPDRARPLHVPRDDRLGRGPEPGRRGDRARAGQLGVVGRRTRRPGPARLHPEQPDQDARRSVRRPPCGRRAGLDPDHLGRSSTTRTCARIAGRSGRSCPGSTPSATCSPRPSIRTRPCRRSADRRPLARRRSAPGTGSRRR